jgi:pimeloyl-ACP methyl ester carboxylesterase
LKAGVFVPRFHTPNGEMNLLRQDGGGPPVLFLHGLACTARMWVHQLRAYAGRHTVLAPDFLGHGGSPAPSDSACYTEAQFAADAVAALDAAGVDKAVVVGLSMGGTIGVVMAQTWPQRVAALLMADSGSGSDDPEGTRTLLRGVARRLREDGLEAYAQATLQQSPGMAPYGRQGPRQRRHLLGLLRQNDPIGLALTIEGVQIARPTMYQRDLARIAVPTMVLVGALDRDCIAPSRHAAQAIPGAVYVEIPGAAHLTALEAPAAFNTALDALLSRIPG